MSLGIEELVAAKERAEAASRSKSRFLVNMSHEFRTPLNAVLAFARLLQSDAGLSERQQHALSTIHESGMHLLALVDDILDLAKVEAGRLDLHVEPMSLSDLLRWVSDVIRVKAQDRQLAFDCVVPSDLPQTVLADEKRLRQVLFNLLGNAVKFTERGTVGVRVQTLSCGQQHTRIRFEVVDTGPGIAADHLETIFEPFEQAGDARLRSGGAGLGLAISRQLLRLMGSDIHAESEPGNGSRFWFDIDVALAQACATTLPDPYRAAADRPLLAPPAEELEALHRLARFGNMRAIGEHAAAIGALGEPYRPFANRLRALANGFQSRAIADLIGRYRDG